MLLFNSSDVNDYEYISNAMVAELKFDVVNMSAVDDFRSFGFEASVEFVRLESVCESSHRVYGASGELRLSAISPMSDVVSMLIYFVRNILLWDLMKHRFVVAVL